MENTIYTSAYGCKDIIELPNTHLLVQSQYISTDSKGNRTIENKIILACHDEENKFWAFISKLTPDEAEELAKALFRAIQYHNKGVLFSKIIYNTETKPWKTGPRCDRCNVEMERKKIDPYTDKFVCPKCGYSITIYWEG